MEKSLILIELNDLKKLGKDLAEILKQRLKTDVNVKGGTLTLNDAKVGVKEVKLQVKHVLHQLGLLDEYRVLTEHHKVRIVKVEHRSHSVDKRGMAPAPSQSLPYFFPR
jgi:hypothetical protein